MTPFRTAFRAALHALLAVALAVAGVTALTAVAAPATAAEIGYQGPSYGGTSIPRAPTAEKPQSKLWWANGFWWGALWDAGTSNYNAFRYDWATNTWTDTGSLLETRTNANMDVLFENGKLYVVSSGIGKAPTNPDPEVSRFSYNATSQTWSLDAGFPVKVGTGRAYSPVIARDSTGMLWVTYTSGTQVMVTHSTPGDDSAWVAPYQLPTPNNESTVSYDPTVDVNNPSSDISTIVAYDGNKVGVLWSNQVTGKIYWASHADGAGDRQWTLDVAYDQPNGADDHLNLKAVMGLDSGKVFAVAKTSMDGATDPLINLLVLSQSGQWSSAVYARKADNLTRAMLLIDATNKDLYVFASGPCCSGGTIYYKKTSLANPSFAPGVGDVFMESDANPKLNNPTSTKQPVTASTGLLVMAGDDSTRRYFYNRLGIDSPPPPPPPPPAPLFRDDFSSGGFAAGRWAVARGGNGTAKVFAGAVRPGDPGAQLRSTARRGSTASIRKTLAAAQPGLTVAWDAKVVNAGKSGQRVGLLKVYNALGRRVLTVQRVSTTRRLVVVDRAGTKTTALGPAVGQVVRLSVRVQQAGALDRWSLSVAGKQVAGSNRADLGVTGFRSFRLGENLRRRVIDYRVDNVEVWR